MGKRKVTPIWTVNKTVREGEYNKEVTFCSETAYETLYDALNHIGIWSNMKTMRGFKIRVEPTDESNKNIVCFIAEDEERKIEEEYILEKIDLYGKLGDEDEA